MIIQDESLQIHLGQNLLLLNTCRFDCADSIIQLYHVVWEMHKYIACNHSVQMIQRGHIANTSNHRKQTATMHIKLLLWLFIALDFSSGSVVHADIWKPVQNLRAQCRRGVCLGDCGREKLCVLSPALGCYADSICKLSRCTELCSLAEDHKNRWSHYGK